MKKADKHIDCRRLLFIYSDVRRSPIWSAETFEPMNNFEMWTVKWNDKNGISNPWK